MHQNRPHHSIHSSEVEPIIVRCDTEDHRQKVCSILNRFNIIQLVGLVVGAVDSLSQVMDGLGLITPSPPSPARRGSIKILRRPSCLQEEDYRKKISRLKQKLIKSFVNQAINDRTVSQEDELSTSPFSPYAQEEEDFSTETKTYPPFLSQVINDEIMLEGNELLTSPFPPSCPNQEDFSTETKTDPLLSVRRSIIRLSCRKMNCRHCLSSICSRR
jgi:hypothetical protein